MRVWRWGLAILYDGITLVYNYVLLSSLVFAITSVWADEHSIGIIRAAERPSLFHNLLIILIVAFAVVSVTAAVLLTVTAIKKESKTGMKVPACVLILLSVMLLLLIPPQVYAVPLYILISKVPFMKFAYAYYLVLSGLNAIFLFLPRLSFRRENSG
ncbi:MAG: hypothetical protein IJC33_06875 [Clostridia bacterium]|nr:hypothetical protein [Clostridia bacterium]